MAGYVENHPRLNAPEVWQGIQAASTGDGRRAKWTVFVDGQPVELLAPRYNRSTRFICPRCQRPCRHLYLGEHACRRCCGFNYYHCGRPHLPNWGAITRWRQAIGADPRPFTPLPDHLVNRGNRTIRFRRTVERIERAEAKALRYLRRFNDQLARK